MTSFGYKLSSEEHGPGDLVRFASRAEEAGFSFAAISDHYHPWITKQGHSPFVWTVIGAVARSTEKLKLLTGVTCPTVRIHPAVVAQAAATTSVLMPGRFMLGVGSGENLNEHITGERWPGASIRLEMLKEAVEVIRLLFGGGQRSHRGTYYTVENARLYDLPEDPIPVLVAASGEASVKLAGSIGDGVIGLAPDAEFLKMFDEAGGRGKLRLAEVNVCWNDDKATARRIAHELWPVSGFKGQLMQELPLPAHFEQGAAMVSEDDAVVTVACGPDPDEHVESIRKFIDAGYDHVWIHQIGPDQDGFFRFYENDVLPRLS
jgi:coenzyme F420-dependent glucose-6-phosphate dehydrogenase